MGVLAAKARKTLLFTGTLMGGYGDDLFHLLFRACSGRMIEDSYRPTKSGMTSAAMAFMPDHGVPQDIYSEARARRKTAMKGLKGRYPHGQGAGFRPQGVLRCVLLPFTVFPQAQGHRRCCRPTTRKVPRGGDGHGASRGLSRPVGRLTSR